jgi:hypothetical protein
MFQFIKKNYIILTVILIVTLLSVLAWIFIFNQSNKPFNINLSDNPNSKIVSEFGDGGTAEKDGNKTSTSVSIPDANLSENVSSSSSVKFDESVSSIPNTAQTPKNFESETKQIDLKPEEIKQKLTEVYLPLVKAEFSNGEKVIVTDKIIPEAIDQRLTEVSEFQYPLEDGQNFYIIDKNNDIIDLGEGVVGVYEIKYDGENFRFILAEQETGSLEFYYTRGGYDKPERFQIELEGDFTPGLFEKKSDSVFLIKAYDGQDLVKYKDFEIDLGKLISEQNNE